MVHLLTIQQATQPQIQSQNFSPTAQAFDYDTWKMTTSPPRLFMTPMELGGSSLGASDESSAGTRASSGSFSLISSCEDERLTATDNPVRVPRSAMVDNGFAMSDPHPGGARQPSYYMDESPTPAARHGIWNKGPSLLSRLNFAQGYPHEDARSSRSVSGCSDATDVQSVQSVQSQVMPLYDAASSDGSYSKPSPAPSFADETIKPRLRRRVLAPTATHGVVTSEHYTPVQPRFPAPIDARYQQSFPTPLGFGHMGNNVAYSGANMANMALATAGGYAGSVVPGLGYQASQLMAARPAVLGSPIVMGGPSAPFRPGTALGNGNGNHMVNFPARVHSVEVQSAQLTKLLSGFDGAMTATKMLDAEYFPFVETAREGGGSTNHGVIKITNVSPPTRRNWSLAPGRLDKC
ncbi:hypothetical protein IMZ48_13940 [Candidatus Bathyarchaeota archaeon]|nr:hypothetical protein [Candidatus Bathyarchaeota archaeon]